MPQEYVKVRFSADIRVRYHGQISIPKDVWEDGLDPNHNWSEAADKYLRENIAFDDPGAIDFDDRDVEIDEAALVQK